MTVIAVKEQSSAAQSRRQMLRSLRVPLLIAFIIAALALVAWLAAPRISDVRFAPDNPEEAGGRALAQVLQREGVEVVYTRSIGEALTEATPGSTLVVVTDPGVSRQDSERIAQATANIVLVEPRDDLVNVTSTEFGAELWIAGAYQESPVSNATCSLPAALAAQEIRSNGTGFDFPYEAPLDNPRVSPCFPMDWGFHLVRIDHADGRTLTLFDSAAPFTNAQIVEHGHAALALHILGENDKLVWFLPTPTSKVDIENVGAAIPPQFTTVGYALALTVLFIALWQGRRTGPVLSEELPVVVKSSETTIGRGKLYRAANDHGRAASALRAGSATRIARRLGIPAASTPEHFSSMVAHATSLSAEAVHTLFYAPAPTNDLELITLAQSLSALESELHR